MSTPEPAPDTPSPPTDVRDIRDEVRRTEFRAYIRKIAEARYVVRKVIRIINDQAQQHGFDPLLHQALLQVYGSDKPDGITVSALAQRLDIAPALASRLARQLADMGMITRGSAATDRRVSLLTATADGIAQLERIDQAAFYEYSHFHRQLTEDQKYAALSIFAFYVGMDSEEPITQAIRRRG